MEGETIKTKELPIVSLDVEISSDDRVVATHVVDSNTRETVGITVGALRDKFIADAANGSLFPKNIFDTVDPTSDVGYDGDLYFKVNGTSILSSYFKINGEWYPFRISDDNWDKFLAGEAFDLISNAKSVKAYAFDGNTNIRRVIMPLCETVYEYAFRGCSIRSLDMPSLKTVYEGAFKGTTSWNTNQTISLSSIESIGNDAFRDIILETTSSINMDIENVTTIGNGSFYRSRAIVFVHEGYPYILNLPNCTTIGQSAFGTDSSGLNVQLHEIYLPSIETIDSQAFRGIDFKATESDHAIIKMGANITSIGSGLFWAVGSNIINTGVRSNGVKGAYVDLYIEATTPPALLGHFVEMFASDPIEFSPNIYVPESAVNTYKTDTAWSFYSDYIQAISN